MTKQSPKLAQSYLLALRAYLASRRPTATAARQLGSDVMAAGFSVLDLARMHELAVGSIVLSNESVCARRSLVRRAGRFFTEALVPLAKKQRAARETLQQLQLRTATMRLHTAALAASNRELKREVRRRQAGEAAVRRGKEHYHRLFVHSQFMQEKLRHLARQILHAQENERREISRELHDEVVQSLVGINVQLAALGKAASNGIQPLKARIALTQRLVEKSVNAVHQFARELRPAVLDDLGLIPALHAFMKTLARRKKLKIRLTAFAGVEALDNTKRTVFYRVAQEALTNVGRHAHATVVDVSIAEIPGAVRMEVRDNGRAFQVLQTLSAKTNKRLGLLGMRERVEMVGGTLVIASVPGEGTTVRAEIPFSAKGAA